MDNMVRLNSKEIQNRLLDLMSKFADFCEKNKLSYFISSGTCLGAVRHNGFIPWDDDADFMMPRKDYEKLLLLLANQKEIVYMTYKTNKTYYYPFLKIIDDKTILIEKEKKPIRDLGLFIDVFPVDGLVNGDLSMNKKYIKLQKLKRLLCRKNSKHSNFLKNILCKITTLFVSTYYLCDKINKLSSQDAIDKCDYVMDILRGTKPFNKNVLDNFIYVKFEDRLFKIPENYDSYLKSIYGDYLTLPPKEQQISHELIVFEKE